MSKITGEGSVFVAVRGQNQIVGPTSWRQGIDLIDVTGNCPLKNTHSPDIYFPPLDCKQGDPHKSLAFALASYASLKSPYQHHWHQPYLPLAPGIGCFGCVEQSKVDGFLFGGSVLIGIH